MWINRKTGTMHGRLGDKVYYVRFGRQCVRSLAPRHSIKNSARFQQVKIWFSEATAIWRDLPGEIKNLWESHAVAQGRISDIERNEPICTRHCPIPSYPPRPKLLGGIQCFAGAYVLARKCLLAGLRLLAPKGSPIPPAPLIDCDYNRDDGELTIWIDTPQLVQSIKHHDRKILLWMTVISHHKKLVNTRLIDVVDFPDEPTRLELRYKGIAETHKTYGYKPLVFAKPDYLLLYIGAQALTTTSPLRAPVVSACSNILHYYILNETKLAGIEDLIKGGEIINPGNIRWGARFLARIAKLRQQSDKIVMRGK